METFSQRKGIKPLFKQPQVNDLDQETRNQAWTALKVCVFDYWNGNPYDNESIAVQNLYKQIWSRLFKLPIDSIPSYYPHDHQSAYKHLRQLILAGTWNEALDLIEFIIKNVPNHWENSLTEFINIIFKHENVGYRIVSREIAEITDPIETESITDALSSPKKPIQTHLSKALELLSDRKSPDYRNSIKESISAVEAACKIITNKPKATLSDCIKTIKEAHSIPVTLDQALTKLYAYTNAEEGIRHALTCSDEQPTFADAKFMLVSCTAFINYLWTIAAETGLDIS